MIDKAIAFATAAHDGQKRKFTGEPYIIHPLRVMSIVSTVPRVTPEMVAAAVLHDVLEDTAIDAKQLRATFDHEVVQLVVDLTTPKAISQITNRDVRARTEAVRLAKVRRQSQTIKFADIIDNAGDLWERDPKFAAVYLPEKAIALDYMRDGNYDLWTRATALCAPKTCGRCGATPVRDVLDGDPLCQQCCEAFARGEKPLDRPVNAI